MAKRKPYRPVIDIPDDCEKDAIEILVALRLHDFGLNKKARAYTKDLRRHERKHGPISRSTLLWITGAHVEINWVTPRRPNEEE